jgi:hypothetical protein
LHKLLGKKSIQKFATKKDSTNHDVGKPQESIANPYIQVATWVQE